MYNWNKKGAIIVYHDSVFGPPHELRDFLKSEGIGRLVCIGHVNRFVPENEVKSTYVEVYKDKKLCNRHESIRLSVSEPLQYILDFIKTIFWSLRFTEGKTDFFIGLGNLNALAGIILKKMGMIQYVIYYVIDYVPQRFPNRVLNSFYHWLDSFCARSSDATWNYAASMIEARSNKWNHTFPNQLVVPNGIHVRISSSQTPLASHKYELIYLGTLFEHQGLQLAISALPEIKKRFPKAKVTVIGDGPYRGQLETIVKSLGVTREVTFMGKIEDPIEADRRVALASLGIAMYTPDHPMVRFTEPGKVKRYLANAVPVIMTDIGQAALEVKKWNCGLVVPFKTDRFSRAVIDFFSDSTRMQRYRKQAVAYAKRSEWSLIFANAFKKFT